MPTRTIGVAIAIPEPWGGDLRRRRADLGDPLAASVPTHVTLLPPTQVDEAALDAVDAHLRRVAAGAAPFDLHLRGAGTFRPVSPVVFVQVARGIGGCERLEEAVRSGPLARSLDFPYHPHVTVAHHLPDDVLDRAYDELGAYDAAFRVERFSLYVHGADEVWRPHRDYPLGAVG
ncbi:2'-5' RNA ligase family protein [Vallicoccus soli]|uniref:2'-5' RNA ligase family protein n=1 Tax=Vallicoccus soli TaxID=2339232 RepID=A0A3A3ZIE9_9ACTN|nr:2'-5' RNA ligase family protein [Vallicoccus soli]RJK95276.1 2'-5' RNA ligase family protein [Vallicoccus soli]